MTNLGFKKLTVDNWTEPDKASSLFVRISPVDEQAHPITGDEWVRHILKPNLIEAVPADVRALFEVARGAIAYGYFFYPLYALAEEQLYRVVEAAVTFKCKEMGAPQKIRNFWQKVNYLTDNKVIPKQEEELWHAIRKLRNMSSHPKFQTIISPGNAISTLERTAEKINFLFSSE